MGLSFFPMPGNGASHTLFFFPSAHVENDIAVSVGNFREDWREASNGIAGRKCVGEG